MSEKQRERKKVTNDAGSQHNGDLGVRVILGGPMMVMKGFWVVAGYNTLLLCQN